jgi:hypothetical protein
VYFASTVRIAEAVLTIEGVMHTEKRCAGLPAELERIVDSVLYGRVGWTVHGEELRLSKPDGTMLVFTPRDSVYPGRDLTPLLQGQRDGGDYRFGWGPQQPARLVGLGVADRAGDAVEPGRPGRGEDLDGSRTRSIGRACRHGPVRVRVRHR